MIYNDIPAFKKAIHFKLSILEKPWIYSDGKRTMTDPFKDSKKLVLNRVAGESMLKIIESLNVANPEAVEIFLLVGKDGHIWKETGKDGITIRCLVI